MFEINFYDVIRAISYKRVLLKWLEIQKLYEFYEIKKSTKNTKNVCFMILKK